MQSDRNAPAAPRAPRRLAAALGALGARKVGAAAGLALLALLALLAGTAVWLRDDVPSDPEDQRAGIAFNGRGRFTEVAPVDPSAGLDAEQRETIARLEAIGYASGVLPAGPLVGVTQLDGGRAWPGSALYVSGHAPEALLIDLEGNVLHRWGTPIESVWPDWAAAEGDTATARDRAGFFFRRAHLFENGDLLVVFQGYGLVKLDRDSRVIWALRNQAHHDLDVLEDGRIVTLTRKAHLIPRIDPVRPKLEDFVVVLDADGSETFRLSLVEALERSRWRDALTTPDPRLPERIQQTWRDGDLLHANAVEIVREDHPQIPWLRRGHAIVSCRFQSAILAIDLARREVVWFHQGEFVGQHEPRVLPSGRILLFDNGNHVGRSRALEIDAESGRIVWQYPGERDEPLFSQCCSTATRLPNGNTQLVFTDLGVAREVTPSGEIVWELASPHRAGERNELVAALFDVVRLPAEHPLAWASARLVTR